MQSYSTFNFFNLKSVEVGNSIFDFPSPLSAKTSVTQICSVEIINETGFQKAIFYDDNAKYIKRATKVVREKLPNFDFTPVKV